MPSDRLVEIQANHTKLLHKGMVWDLVSETFPFGEEVLTREFIQHTGAVAVLAVNESEEVLLLEQYRRPVRSYLLELPAGLMDEPGESELECAKRELLEEASLSASKWEKLLTFHTTPGGSSESISLFVATEIQAAESNFQPTGEEINMPKIWIPIREAVELVLTSQIKSPSAAVGIMAYALRNGISGKL